MRRLFTCVLLALCLFALPAYAATVSMVWNWDAPDEPPMSYVVERKIGADGVYIAIGNPTETTWTDTDVPVFTDKAVYYQVRAVNERGVSDPSNEISLSLPSAPENVRLLVQTFGPSATAPRVSVRMRVRKSDPAATVPQRPGRTKRKQ